MIYWFEPVLYLDQISKWSEITEMPGYFIDFTDSIELILTFKILNNDLTTVLHRSAVGSSADASH
jgi:hypothetical protein